MVEGDAVITVGRGERSLTEILHSGDAAGTVRGLGCQHEAVFPD